MSEMGLMFDVCMTTIMYHVFRELVSLLSLLIITLQLCVLRCTEGHPILSERLLEGDKL